MTPILYVYFFWLKQQHLGIFQWQRKGLPAWHSHNRQTNTLTYDFHNFRRGFLAAILFLLGLRSGLCAKILARTMPSLGCHNDKHAAIDAIIVCPWIELNQLNSARLDSTRLEWVAHHRRADTCKISEGHLYFLACDSRKLMPSLCLACHRNQATTMGYSEWLSLRKEWSRGEHGLRLPPWVMPHNSDSVAGQRILLIRIRLCCSRRGCELLDAAGG